MIACSPALDSVKIMPRQLSQNNLSEFGLALDEFLEERGWNQTQLSAETEPEVSQGQLSNYRYGRRNPKPETISVLARALTPRHSDQDEENRKYYRILNRLRHAAGLRSIAGKPLNEDLRLSTDPPDNFEDWPLELRQALAHTRTLPRASQELVYKLWLEQARTQADIEVRRQEAERKLEEREALLREKA